MLLHITSVTSITIQNTNWSSPNLYHAQISIPRYFIIPHKLNASFVQKLKCPRFNPQIKILSVILCLEMSNISYIPTVLLNIHSNFFFNQKCWCPTYHDCYPGYHLSLPSFHNNTGKETCYNNSTLLFLYLTHKNCASCFEMKIAFVTIRAE